MTVISYPIPAYSNVPIQPQNYQPRRFVISDITLGRTTLVETDIDHDYVIGQLTRLIIPTGYGCIQLNDIKGYVIDIPSSNELVLDIDSSQNVSQFVAAANAQNPQILAIGDVNSGVVNSQGRKNNITYIPGSFINISPS